MKKKTWNRIKQNAKTKVALLVVHAKSLAKKSKNSDKKWKLNLRMHEKGKR